MEAKRVMPTNKNKETLFETGQRKIVRESKRKQHNTNKSTKKTAGKTDKVQPWCKK